MPVPRPNGLLAAVVAAMLFVLAAAAIPARAQAQEPLLSGKHPADLTSLALQRALANDAASANIAANNPNSEIVVFLKPGIRIETVLARQGIASGTFRIAARLVSTNAVVIGPATRRSGTLAAILALPAADPSAYLRAQIATIARDADVLAALPHNSGLASPERRQVIGPPPGGPPLLLLDPFVLPFTTGIAPLVSWGGQWHLINTVTPGLDLNVEPAWAAGFRGQGVVIGIIDDGLPRLHPDLAPNYIGALSFDFLSVDNDPTPVSTTGEFHGTAVAGVAAARGGNNIGGSGAAPFAGLAGLRTNYGEPNVIDATLFNSGGVVGPDKIHIKNHSYGFFQPYVDTSAQLFALVASTNSGAIHTFSAGNERGGLMEDGSKRMLSGSVYAIAAAALSSNGKFAPYSCYGGSITVTAPSGATTGLIRQTGILTTDRVTDPIGYSAAETFPDGDYTTTFNGTSSAAPAVAGVLALVKQAQPRLTTRMAKHLLARTSRIVDPLDVTISSDGGWKTNAAGIPFNPNYGFGLLDADALIAEARLWAGVTTLSLDTTGLLSPGLAIPDGMPAGVTYNFTLNSSQPMEELEIFADIPHTWRGDIEAYVTSPRGTTRRIWASNIGDSADNINWVFASNAFWGEIPRGTWRIRLADVFGADTGQLRTFQATARIGQLRDPLPANVTIARVQNVRRASGALLCDLVLNNSGELDGTGVRITYANLGGRSTRTPLPQFVGDVPSGGSLVVPLVFSGVLPRQQLALVVRGAHDDGTFNASVRVLVP